MKSFQDVEDLWIYFVKKLKLLQKDNELTSQDDNYEHESINKTIIQHEVQGIVV